MYDYNILNRHKEYLLIITECNAIMLKVWFQSYSVVVGCSCRKTRLLECCMWVRKQFNGRKRFLGGYFQPTFPNSGPFTSVTESSLSLNVRGGNYCHINIFIKLLFTTVLKQIAVSLGFSYHMCRNPAVTTM